MFWESLSHSLSHETRAESLATSEGPSLARAGMQSRSLSGTKAERLEQFWNSATICEDGKKSHRYHCPWSDITERKVAEERVSFQGVFTQSVRNAVIATDLEAGSSTGTISEVLYQWKSRRCWAAA